MGAVSACNKIEAACVERKRRSVSLTERHVRGAVRLRQLRGDRQHLGRNIDGDYAPDEWRQRERSVTGSASKVEYPLDTGRSSGAHEGLEIGPGGVYRARDVRRGNRAKLLPCQP